MSSPCKSVCLIVGNLHTSNVRLQPWRYLHEVVLQLMAQGHEVTVISDCHSPTRRREVVEGVLVHRVPAVGNPWWRKNTSLQHTIQELMPDVILWHVGLTTFLHQRLDGGTDAPIIGVFTSPIYSIQNLARLGHKRLAAGYRLSALHILGTLIPKTLLRRLAARNDKLQLLVVQTCTAARQLLESGLWSKRLEAIGPGVDEIWRYDSSRQISEVRARLGYDPADVVMLYFGSPAPLRGLHTLVKAFEQVRHAVPSLRLLILSRRHQDELLREDAVLARMIHNSAVSAAVQIVSGYLEKEALVQMVAACDVVALPFELVPSDAPLSLLEARALGKTIVTTSVACLPELAAWGMHYLAEPADPYSLAQAIQQAVVNEQSKREKYPTGAKGNVTPAPIRSWQQVGEEWSRLIQTL